VTHAEINTVTQVSVHESGHVLGVRLANGTLHTVSIVPTLLSDGYVESNGDGFENIVLLTLMGRAAELEFGFRDRYDLLPFKESTDYNKANAAIIRHIKYQRCETLGLPHFEWDIQPQCRVDIVGADEKVPRGRRIRRLEDGRKAVTVNLVQEWRNKLRVRESEWKPILNKYVRQARRLAKKHRAYIETVAQLLAEKYRLQDADVPQLTDTTLTR
jgi:hypothetical protein